MDAPLAKSVVSNMNSSAAIQMWRMAFQGLMYYGTFSPIIENPEEQLAILLNTMMMIQWGNSFLLSTPLPDDDQTYDCLTMPPECREQ
jgi:hypothetical protein